VTQERNSGAGRKPLTARQITASTLLGVDPPRLPSRQLVRAGELFGVAEGATRVALSRMVASGDLVAEDGWYRLAGPLLERQARQAEGRHPELLPWAGGWTMAAIVADRRPATDRNQLRRAMRALRMAELREGLWLRPDNLDPDRLPGARAVARDQCRFFVARPSPDDDPRALVAALWALDDWSAQARRLVAEMEALVVRLDREDTTALRPGWELSASVLRHLLADPLLPPELEVPAVPGVALRSTYDRFDRSFKRLWRDGVTAR
jgi:phenylacetic acid degradation operon negative regulatory protein